VNALAEKVEREVQEIERAKHRKPGKRVLHTYNLDRDFNLLRKKGLPITVKRGAK